MPAPVDRFRGGLLAGAAGDALGAAVEFDGADAIRRRFGPDGIADPAEAYGRAGAITDDTQMTLFTAEGLLAAGPGLAVDDVAAAVWAAYGRWLRTQEAGFAAGGSGLLALPALWSRRAPGVTCLTALRGGLGGHRTGPDGVPVAPNDSKGCGGVMRVAPCGLLARDAGQAFALGRAAAALTHGHPSGHLAAGAFAVAVRALVDGRTVAEAVDAAVAALGDDADAAEVRDALVRARELAARPGPPADVAALGEGWVAEEALAIAAFCALVDEDDLPAALRRAANHGGDSDSTAAIAGNLLGARHGVDAVPAAWLDVLELREEIDALAVALHARGR